ncbi:MAG: PTS fructose transporter subunit IIA [Erysipelotrichia bacterium]|nr:PTS fructose transporter subunit IIA [Erysipelotrichia bacterium]
MELKEILDPSIISLQVNGTDKDEVLRSLSRLLLNNGYIDDVDQFVADIYDREKEGPTGMGSSLSIPHGKSAAAKKIGIAIGRTINPIKWESSIDPSGFQDTEMIFLFCVSADQSFAENHMILLSQLAGKLGNDARIQKLKTCTDAEEIISTIVCDDSVLEGPADSEEEIVDLDINV